MVDQSYIHKMSNALDLSFIREILICEDHPFVQLGLRTCLEEVLPRIQNIRIASTGNRAIDMVKSKKPDLMLLDLGLPDISGIEVIQSLKAIWTDLKILVVTSSDNAQILSQVKKLKVQGIMQKSSTPEQLRSLLQSMQKDSHQIALDPAISTLLESQGEINFTNKEFEILQEVVKGLPNSQIALNLGCSVTTVRFHRTNILHKANFRTGAELTAWYLSGQGKRN